jgi:hypothetical protein
MTYKLNGKVVSRKEFCAGAKRNWLERPPMAANTYTEHDPLISEALGCMKSQVPDMRKLIESEGIQGVKVLDSGQARITSRRGRNHLMRVLSEIRGNQYHDVDAGYGDF